MYSKNVIVKNNSGLHTKDLTTFILCTHQFKSKIWIEHEERRINAKSLLAVLSLDVKPQTEITIIADGEDSEQAVNDIVSLIESNFGNT